LSSTALSMATMSSEPKIPSSFKIGIPVKPKQSQTGVMWVARERWMAFSLAKVERVMAVEIAQAS